METWYFPRLDAVTMVFAIALLSYFMAAISFTLARGHRGNRYGLYEWGVSMLCGAIAFTLFTYSGHAPFGMTFLLANTFVMATCPFGLTALARLFEATVPTQSIALTIFIGMSGVVAVYFFGANRLFAVFTISLAASVQIIHMAIMIVRAKGRRTSQLVWLNVGAMVLLALAFSMRAFLSLFGNADSVLPAANSMPQISALTAGALFFIISTIGFISMANEKQRHETEERLRRDGLTGLYTRTAFFEMTKKFDDATYQPGYAIVLVDIDHFKNVNDTYGHSGGDIVLAHTARLLASSVRTTDLAVRYGGEEFCLLLKGCDEQDAARFAERLVDEVARQTVRVKDGLNVRFTLSAGYACKAPMIPSGSAPEKLESVIERADRALYAAKNAGRNQARGELAQPLFQLVGE